MCDKSTIPKSFPSLLRVFCLTKEATGNSFLFVECSQNAVVIERYSTISSRNRYFIRTLQHLSRILENDAVPWLSRIHQFAWQYFQHYTKSFLSLRHLLQHSSQIESIEKINQLGQSPQLLTQCYCMLQHIMSLTYGEFQHSFNYYKANFVLEIIIECFEFILFTFRSKTVKLCL